jgi:tryptophanyl-tRNA synthetase
MANQAVDPWSSELPEDYDKKITDFGLTRFDKDGNDDDLITKIKDPHYTMRRGIMFAHRDFENIVDVINKEEPFVMMTGLMPSGKLHFGHKLVIDQIKWFQDHGAEVVVAISDTEAWVARGISTEDSSRVAIEEYITNYLALGLDPDKLDVYSQWQRDDLINLAIAFSGKKTLGEMNSIYGFVSPEGDIEQLIRDEINGLDEKRKTDSDVEMKDPLSFYNWGVPSGKTFFPFIQVSDILHPQLPKYGGLRPTVVPVGIDQDPHLRLTRAIAEAWRQYKVGFTPEHGEVMVYVKGKGAELKNKLKTIESEVIELGYEKTAFDEKGKEIQLIKRISNSSAILVSSAGQYDIKDIQANLEDVVDDIYVTDNRLGIFVEQNDKSQSLLSKAERVIKNMGYTQVEVLPKYGAIFIYDRDNVDKRAIDEKLLHLEAEFGLPVFYKPASTYNRLARGLTGGKMASSEPNSAIFLTDDPSDVVKKIMHAETGGKQSAEEQRTYGGEPDECMIFELQKFNHPEDEFVENTYSKCKSGGRLCGECKKITAEYFSGWMKDFQAKRKELINSGTIDKFVKDQNIFRTEDILC